MTEYARSVELDPDNVDTRVAYGLALGRAENPDSNARHEKGADEILKVVNTPSYKGADAWINLGWLYRDMEPKKIDESIDAYQKGMALAYKQETKLAATQGLAWAYFYGERWDEAWSAFENAAQLDPALMKDTAIRKAWIRYFQDKPKNDMERAKEELARAKAIVQVEHPLLDRLERAIKRFEEDQRPDADETNLLECDINGNMQKLHTGNVAVKKNALVALKKCGRDGALYIAYGLRVQDIEVRETALDALRYLKKKACAKETLEQLQIALRVPPACPQCMPEDEARVHDVLRGTRDIIVMCQGH
jgi:tetratricopeptide (TPR) repeat protein